MAISEIRITFVADPPDFQLQHKIERNEAAFSFHAPVDDVFAVASLLKVRKFSSSSGVFKLIRNCSSTFESYPNRSSGSPFKSVFSIPAIEVGLISYSHADC